MNYEQELKRNVDRLFVAVIAQAVRDLSDKDKVVRKSAENFFTKGEVAFPSDNAEILYHKIQPAVQESIKNGTSVQKSMKYKITIAKRR